MPSYDPYAEKRNFKRLDMNCPVSYQLMGGSSTKTGTCINLSASGVLLACDESYPVGTKININVSPKPSISPIFSAVMEVVRVNLTEKKETFHLGGMLISEEHLGHLNASWNAQ